MHTHHSDTHQSHPAIVKRLRRAGGHLNSIVEMIEQGRSCLDIAQQLQAVEKAIQQAKKTLIQDPLITAWRMWLAPWRAINASPWPSSKRSPDTCEPSMPSLAELIHQGTASV